MAKLTNQMICSRIAQRNRQTNRQKESEDKSVILMKLTHLFFQNRNIHEIGNISLCTNVKVLYLQCNSITHIENLDYSRKLTHLYLQNNKITKIENLQNLRNLEKLFLGFNCIAVVEGLDQLLHLRELHLEKQSLPSGEALQFDPRTTEALSDTLILLDVSKNRLTSLYDLCPLKSLQELHACSNAMENMKDVCEPLQSLPNLRYLDLTGNSICKFHKYRDMILVSGSSTLAYLDNKNISEITRKFVKNFETFKERQSHSSFHRKAPINEDLMEFDHNKLRGVSEFSFASNVPHKTVLSPVNSFFPPWGTRRKLNK